MKFAIKEFFSKCNQICKKLWIWSDFLKKSLVENFIFCAVNIRSKPKIEIFYRNEREYKSDDLLRIYWEDSF